MFPEKFGFCTGKIVSIIEWPNPAHSISVIVSRLTSFIEDFVICCYQVTKLFCSKYWFASAPSAQSPCHFWSFADVGVSVFREVTKNAVHARDHSCRRFLTKWFTRDDCGCFKNCVWHVLNARRAVCCLHISSLSENRHCLQAKSLKKRL